MECTRPLWAHQIETIRRAAESDCFAIFNDPGTGKTRTLIEILRAKYAERGRLMRTLIFCPPIVIENWRDEWKKYSKVPREFVVALTGTGKERLNTLVGRGFEEDLLRGAIFITNYESLQMEDLFRQMQAWKPEVLVFDESHRLKDYHRTAVRARRAEQLANPGTKKEALPRPLVYCLTGTPIPNSFFDIFQQYKILDGGRAFGKNFTDFKVRYFRDKNAGMPKDRHFPKWVIIPGAEEEIAKKMAVSSTRVKLSECMDLPPVVNKTIAVPMAKEQARLYKEMLKEYVTYFEREGQQHASVANLAIVKGLRLMQLASGYVKTDSGDEFSVVEDGWTPKQEALAEILSDLIPGHKVIVWAVWKNNYQQIRDVCAKLGVRLIEMNGEQGSKKNRENAKLFDETNDYDVILGHPESGGEGINLVSSAVRVSYSRNFSWRQMKQSDARNYRGGSERHESITRINLVTAGTIEEKITERLANHEEITENVLREITLSLKG